MTKLRTTLIFSAALLPLVISGCKDKTTASAVPGEAEAKAEGDANVAGAYSDNNEAGAYAADEDSAASAEVVGEDAEASAEATSPDSDLP